MKPVIKKRFVLSAALLLGATAYAAAQTAPPANDSKAAAPAPAAIQNAPPDKVENDPKLKARAEPKGAAETTGDAAKPESLDAAPKPGVTAHPIDQLDNKQGKNSDLPQPDKK